MSVTVTWGDLHGVKGVTCINKNQVVRKEHLIPTMLYYTVHLECKPSVVNIFNYIVQD